MKKLVILLTGIFLFQNIYGITVPISQLEYCVKDSAVNDHAHIFSPTERGELEKVLRAYYDSAQISIVVATVPSLQGYEAFDYSLSLFNYWGIGYKGEDRGVLIFLAPNERKISIRTGRGIEPFLTDLKSGELVDILKSYCKEKQYAAGMNDVVNQIITHLGKMSWEDRMEGIALRAQQEEREAAASRQATREVLFWAGVIIIFFSIFGGIVFLINRILKKRRLKKESNELLLKLEAEIKSANISIDTNDWFSNKPTWVVQEANEYQDQIRASVTTAQKSLQDAQEWYNLKTYKQANQGARNGLMYIQKAFYTFTKLNESLQTKHEKITRETPEKFAETKELVFTNNVKIQQYIKEGYKFNRLLEDHNELQKQVDTLSSKLQDTNTLIDTYRTLPLIVNGSNEIMGKIESLLETEKKVTNTLQKLPAQARTAFSLFAGMIEKLEDYKKSYPENVWGQSIRNARILQSKSKAVDIVGFQEEILELNKKSAGRFIEAYQRVVEMQELVDKVNTLNTSVNIIASSQVKAKTDCTNLITVINPELEKLLSKIKDSDVSSSTRKIAKNCATTLESIKLSMLATLVDWVNNYNSLKDLHSDIQDAMKKAKKDISNAEDNRRSASRNRSSYDSNSSYGSFSSNSFSSSSNDSYGGFGGGSSGGGGADGSY